MACYHPLKAFPIGKTDSGKVDYKVTSYDVDHLELNDKGVWIKCYDNFIASCVKFQKTFIEVPCGKCIGCRLERSRQWANRCLMELQYHEESWFVTLTYDNENLRYAESYDTDTGEVRTVPTLQKKDFQLFMKRLRKAYTGENKIRFFMCGEYGEHTKRPHYHAILFGLHLDDLEKIGQNELGNPYYTSKFLEKLWPYGFHLVAPVTWETCAYTARYITKKLTGEAADVYEEFNLQPEFTLMSRRPGIAAQYFADHPTIMDYDLISVSTEKGGKSFRAPRYFQKLYDKDNPVDPLSFWQTYNSLEMQLIREHQKQELEKTSLDYKEYLQTKELNKNAQIKALKRKGV